MATFTIMELALEGIWSVEYFGEVDAKIRYQGLQEGLARVESKTVRGNYMACEWLIDGQARQQR